MPQAYSFADSVNGNDGNSGLTWALAKATIQAAVNLWPDASGGYITACAGTTLFNESVTTFPYPGADANNRNLIIADCQEEYTDAGANTHGFGVHRVTWYLRSNTTGPLSAFNYSNFAWVDVRRFVMGVQGSWTGLGALFKPSNAGEEFRIMDNVLYGSNQGAYAGIDTSIANGLVLGYRNLFQGGNPGLQVPPSNKSAGFLADPDSRHYSSIMIGEGTGTERSGVYVSGNNSSNYTYASVDNCLLRANIGSTLGAPITGGSATYSKCDSTRTIGVGRSSTMRVLCAGASVDDYYFRMDPTPSSETGVTDLVHPVWGIPPELDSEHPCYNPLADYSGSLTGEAQYDLYGNTLEKAIGPIEWSKAPQPQEAGGNNGRGILAVQLGTGGGGGPLLGGLLIGG